ncbi:SLAM family member 5-like isoform 2-T2 [Anableps anableps]
MAVSQNLFVVFLVTTVQLISADPIYRRVGGSVALNPGQGFDSIRTVTWKHRSDLALEWFGDKIICYRSFQGRCDLDKETGSFIINNLMLEDSGSYTPEINDRVLDRTDLQAIKPVPKPTVTIKCNDERTLCNLTCEAKITAEFGPVTYKWRAGDKDLSNDKELQITTENEESSFICELKNPVSSSSGDEKPNPVSKGTNPAAVIVPVVILILILVVVGVAFLMYKRETNLQLDEAYNGGLPALTAETMGENDQNQNSSGPIIEDQPGQNSKYEDIQQAAEGSDEDQKFVVEQETETPDQGTEEEEGPKEEETSSLMQNNPGAAES